MANILLAASTFDTPSPPRSPLFSLFEKMLLFIFNLYFESWELHFISHAQLRGVYQNIVMMKGGENYKLNEIPRPLWKAFAA